MSMNQEELNRSFILAVCNGHLEVVKYLLEQGADIHANDDEVLYVAANNNYFEIAEYLLHQGADLSQLIKPNKTVDENISYLRNLYRSLSEQDIKSAYIRAQSK